jgi:hypothetical protein
VALTAAIAQRLEMIKSHAFTEMSADDRARFERIENLRGPVKWRGAERNSSPPSAYPAKRLEAVWATPPYLHNGSVPTLYHLLLPAAERPRSFPVGHEDYDPARLGIELEPSQITAVRHRPPFTFDTTIAGNLNSGHEGEEFGTTLSDGDRAALIEYLKVHQNPR